MNRSLSWVILMVILGLISAIAILDGFRNTDNDLLLLSTWQEHRALCQTIPIERYHEDRARAVRGTIRDTQGRAVAGVLVRSMPIVSLGQVTRSTPPDLSAWTNLVEAEGRTDAEGRYEFSHFAEGSRILCVSAPGRAPACRGPIVVQDGSGARVDLTLEPAETLRVRLETGIEAPFRLTLIPHRWWPELIVRDVASGEGESVEGITFTGLGGPYHRGLLLLSKPNSFESARVVGSFDLSQTRELAIGDRAISAPPMPEIACLDTWDTGPSEALRLFFGTLSPTALFVGSGPADAKKETQPSSNPRPTMTATTLRGRSRSGYLPILIESRDGGSWLSWTSEAAEFELTGVPPGIYRARSMDSFGQISFARGLVAAPSGVTELMTGFGSQIELTEKMSRELMGSVRWEDGRPAEKAEVFIQDGASFRRFLQRVVTDSNGFFRVPNVPGNATYLIFALPSAETEAMKRMSFVKFETNKREAWIDLQLSPHALIGRCDEVRSGVQLELAGIDEKQGQSQVLWKFSPDANGQFRVTNVPHGRYVVRTTNLTGERKMTSLPCQVETSIESIVNWPESQLVGPASGSFR